MIVGAKELMRRRGVNATTMREVVRFTGTPRGSIAFHFPGGKVELLQEAIEQARVEVSAPLAHLCETRGVLAGLRSFIAGWQALLTSSNFEEGCPILAVAIEEYVPENSATEDTEAGAQHAELLARAHVAFAEWQTIIAAALRKEGVSPARARRLAAIVVASVEGTLAMCRAARSAQPLEDVRHELEALIKQALTDVA
jgi:AcrR family transcriptional regulator